jgi:Cu(I)/Ag(I) efflux system membrane fusion protein
MKTKWILTSLAALALGFAAFGVTGCKKAEHDHSSGEHAHQYTCSMHPEVVKDAPGDCPKCGMKLVEKK